MVNLLENPIWLPIFASFTVALAFTYLYIEPRLVRHHWWSDMLDMLIMLTMTGVAISVLISTPWRNPLTQDGLIYDLFMARVNGQPDTAHAISYLTIPAIFWLTRLKTRDSWKSLLFSCVVVAINESLWYLMYYYSYRAIIDWAGEFWPDVTYYWLMLSFLTVWLLKYGRKKLWIIAALALAFDIIWGLLGSPITVTNSRSMMVAYRITEYWGDWHVNALEVGHWLLGLLAATIWLRKEVKRQ